MRAINVYADTEDVTLVGEVVNNLNQYDDITAFMVDRKQIFIAGIGECAVKYAECICTQMLGAGEFSVKSWK